MTNHNNIPALRFSEFKGEWKKKRLSDFNRLVHGDGDWILSKDISPNGEYRIIQLGNIGLGRYIDKELKTVSKATFDELNCTLILKGDLLINRMVDSSLYACIFEKNGNYITSVDICWIRKSDNFHNKFMELLILNKHYQNSLLRLSSGSGRVRISKKNLFNSFKFYLPSLPEQQKIANFLTAIDKKIEQLRAKHRLLEAYKKGIMQQIFKQDIRFKDDDGEAFGDWEAVQLKDVLTEHKTRNSENKYDEVLSVAKSKGVINQIKHLGRSYASSDISNYKVVFPNDIVYTKSPTSDFPYGIIKQSQLDRTGVVSVLYAVFRPKNKYIGFLLHNYFLSWQNTFNYLHPLVHKGAKNTMNINNTIFLKGRKIKLPVNIKEQQKIANFLSSIDEKIGQVREQVQAMEEFKKGLLQRMFV